MIIIYKPNKSLEELTKIEGLLSCSANKLKFFVIKQSAMNDRTAKENNDLDRTICFKFFSLLMSKKIKEIYVNRA